MQHLYIDILTDDARDTYLQSSLIVQGLQEGRNHIWRKTYIESIQLRLTKTNLRGSCPPVNWLTQHDSHQPHTRRDNSFVCVPARRSRGSKVKQSVVKSSNTCLEVKLVNCNRLIEELQLTVVTAC